MKNFVPTSKILIHHHSKDEHEFLKGFCQKNNLIGLKDNNSKIIDIFKLNTDLGAVFIPNTHPEEFSVPDFVNEMHLQRPEIPIFLRQEGNCPPIPRSTDKQIAGTYSFKDESSLQALVDKYLFTKHYPITLIRGIQESTKAAYESKFSDINVDVEPPYLVNDQFIYGELFSLIPLESHWCRGFMMLQTKESEIMDLIKNKCTTISTTAPTPREVGDLIGEITNMVWGDIKARFFDTEVDDNSVNNDMKNHVHVPILVNHEHKYISFGPTEPYLCFKYNFSPINERIQPFSVYQKLVFNLVWEPQQFSDSRENTQALVNKGELEFL